MVAKCLRFVPALMVMYDFFVAANAHNQDQMKADLVACAGIGQQGRGITESLQGIKTPLLGGASW
jgi:hypothetical protein